jgi:hypothetical protein
MFIFFISVAPGRRAFKTAPAPSKKKTKKKKKKKKKTKMVARAAGDCICIIYITRG